MQSKKKKCPKCGKKSSKMQGGYCPSCRKEYFADYYQRNRAKINAQVEARRKADPEKHLANRREKNRKLKIEVIAAYGGKCVCCKEKNIEFLAVDHENGGGRKHRTEIAGTGSAFYAWLKRNKFPKDGLRVLCHNCNQSLGLYGYCPHQSPSKFICVSPSPKS
jgi:hypothetical protein